MTRTEVHRCPMLECTWATRARMHSIDAALRAVARVERHVLYAHQMALTEAIGLRERGLPAVRSHRERDQAEDI